LIAKTAVLRVEIVLAKGQLCVRGQANLRVGHVLYILGCNKQKWELQKLSPPSWLNKEGEEQKMF